MANGSDQDKRLLTILDDAMWATIWCALALAVLLTLSFVMFLVVRSMGADFSMRMWGLTPIATAVVWIGTIALGKLTAWSFIAMAFGLWVWKRRVSRRLFQGSGQP